MFWHIKNLNHFSTRLVLPPSQRKFVCALLACTGKARHREILPHPVTSTKCHKIFDLHGRLPVDTSTEDFTSILQVLDKWVIWSNWAQQCEPENVEWAVEPEMTQKWRQTLERFQLEYKRLVAAKTEEERKCEHNDLVGLKTTIEIMWETLYAAPEVHLTLEATARGHSLDYITSPVRSAHLQLLFKPAHARPI